MVYINGATTEPLAIINKPPNTTNTSTIGANQIFFLTFRNVQNSSKTSNEFPFYKTKKRKSLRNIVIMDFNKNPSFFLLKRF